MLPDEFSHYAIIAKIGEGGMGEVYLAEDTMLERKVVIKILSNKIAEDARASKRLIKEARSLSSLEHPNICTVYEIGEIDGRNFIAMQYIEGETLNVYALGHAIPVREALDIAIQIADALAASHAKEIIHRDIKPQNIIINPQGQLKVLDFGLAKRAPLDPVISRNAKTQSMLSEQQTLIGTIPYMSPEQICTEELDATTDIFSFGTLMYELLCGEHPFTRKSNGETLSAILTSEPPPLRLHAPELPEKFEQVIRRCLEKDKHKRFRDGRELLNALVEVKEDIQSGTVQRRPEPLKPPRRLRLYTVAALLVFALALGGMGLFLLYRGDRPPAKPAAIDSIAILPLDNGSDESLEYISDGLTDSLINNLSQLSEVKVIARNSVFKYKGKQIDPATVGRELKVRSLLTGKLTQQSDTITVSVALVDTLDNKHIWGAKYDFKVSDTLNIQESIAREVYQRLRPRLGAQTGVAAMPKNYTDNQEAYQMYLKGRYFWNKRTEAGLKKGIEFFNQAIDLDPNYALAYAGLADSYALLGAAGYDLLAPREAMSRAEAAAAKALELDDTLAEAHTSMAILKLQYAWDWALAEREFKRAIELKPNYAVAHYWYSIYLMVIGKRDESIAESKRAQELDLLSMIANVNVARAFYFARQYDSAIASCRQVIELDEKFFWAYYLLGLSYLQKKSYSEAINALQQSVTLSSGQETFQSALGYAYASSGNKARAEQILKEMERQSSGKRLEPSDVAVLYLALGNEARALDFLEKAYDERSSAMLGLKVEPLFDSLRTEPRYQLLLSRLGLNP